MIQYIYIIWILLLIPIYLLIFLSKMSDKTTMFRLGILCAVAAYPIDITWALHDYWHPFLLFSNRFFDIESLIYGYLMGGIIDGIYPVLLRKKSISIPSESTADRFKSLCILIFFSILVICLMLKTKSIVYLTVTPFCIGLIALLLRRDLLAVGTVSGIAYAFISFMILKIVFLLDGHSINTWEIKSLSGKYIVGVPIEELLWAFCIGFGGSLYYKVRRGIAFTSRLESIIPLKKAC